MASCLAEEPNRHERYPQELWPAILASSTYTAMRQWGEQEWYVAWVCLPVTGGKTPRYRVATRTQDGWQGWQVSTIVQVESLLAELWLADKTAGRAVWSDWRPMNQTLAQIAGQIRYAPSYALKAVPKTD
jgi:hypothetical protein